MYKGPFLATSEGKRKVLLSLALQGKGQKNSLKFKLTFGKPKAKAK
jgi:hypothetical protein